MSASLASLDGRRPSRRSLGTSAGLPWSPGHPRGVSACPAGQGAWPPRELGYPYPGVYTCPRTHTRTVPTVPTYHPATYRTEQECRDARTGLQAGGEVG